MAACGDRKIRVFDLKTGDLLHSSTDLGFISKFISISHDSTFVLTSKEKATVIQGFDTETNAPLFTYNKGASSLAFVDDNRFVSSSQYSTEGFVWNVDDNEPTHTILLEYADGYDDHKVMAMCPTMFLIGDGSLIKAFEFANNEWTHKYTFTGHLKPITSLTKVNESLFVSTSWDETAKLWDINKDSKCLFTFLGHTVPIESSVFLQDQKAIATGDQNGNIAVWSIKAYLENNREEDDTQRTARSVNQDHNAHGHDGNGDQYPNICSEP